LQFGIKTKHRGWLQTYHFLAEISYITLANVGLRRRDTKQTYDNFELLVSILRNAFGRT
jgi:hypothetical protein